MFLTLLAEFVTLTVVTVAVFIPFFLLALLAFGLFFSYFHYNAARVAVRVGEAFQNQRDEALFHVDIRKVGIEVDASNRYVLGAGDIVDFSDDFLR